MTLRVSRLALCLSLHESAQTDGLKHGMSQHPAITGGRYWLRSPFSANILAGFPLGLLRNKLALPIMNYLRT